MITKEILENVIDNQQKDFESINAGLQREVFASIPQIDSFATVVTGLRRCGKSTLLLQKLRKEKRNVVFINFDDIRFSSFDATDFNRLHLILKERNIEVVFLDEIQIMDKWEVFVHQLLRESFTVYVTGSNASLLSIEMSSHLTGRNIGFELFPFSYNEFLKYEGLNPSVETSKQYMEFGGMPEYVKNKQKIILSQLVDDILLKDIAVRYSIRDISSLRMLASYLISNVGNYISSNKLAGMFNIKSVSAINEYLSYIENAYLFFFVPFFNYSLKVQQRHPRKIYAVDTGIISALSRSMKDDYGHILENLVFLHLRRKYKQIYYYQNKGECDFVAIDNSNKHLIQVCSELTDFNTERELNGIFNALDDLSVANGTIVTFSQKDIFTYNNKVVNVIPLHEYLLEQMP
ncbi:MAG: ATP-binding protein [Bacteroidales bacterium]|nr:ATP-binding protein [Bacteroidales bacterium]